MLVVAPLDTVVTEAGYIHLSQLQLSVRALVSRGEVGLRKQPP